MTLWWRILKEYGYYVLTWLMMVLTNASRIVAASTQSCWAGVSAWLSINDCRKSSKCTCRWHIRALWPGGWRWFTRRKIKKTHLSLCCVTGLLLQQQRSQGFKHLRPLSVSNQQNLENVKAWARAAEALKRTRMGSKVIWWQRKKSMR